MLALAVLLLASAGEAVSEAKYDIFKFLYHTEPTALLGQLLSTMQNDSVCRNHTNFYFGNLINFSDWALRMLDSSTKIPESVLMGHLTHLGNFDECLSVEEVQDPNNDSFDGQHCLVTYNIPMDILQNVGTALRYRAAVMRALNLPQDNVMVDQHRAAVPGVTLGASLQLSYCLPSSCSPETIRHYLNLTVNSMFNSVTVPTVTCSQGSKGRSLQTEDWIVLAILIFFGTICIISTVYDLRTENYKDRNELLTAFSWYTNGRKLLATSESSSDTLHALHGIRFISMSWVVLGHTYMEIMSIPYINLVAFQDIIPNFWRMYMAGGTVCVDSFFFLSGLLVAYVFLKQMNRSKDASFNIPLYYFHRYIRLTPPYAIMMLLQATLVRYMGSGPLWDINVSQMAHRCQTHWWTGILYVNNYVEVEKMCMGQSWYLAVDMQLFILSPIVLIPLWKWSRKLSLSFLGVLVLCGLSAAFSVSYIKEFPTNMLATNDVNVQKLQYLPTHTRFTPWLIGLLFGLIIYETKRRKLRIKAVHAVIGWLLGATALLGALLGVYPFYQPGWHQSQLENSIYTVLSRPIWALGLGWVVFACATGFGGPINTFLSWSIFQPLSRLTYSVFLVHMTYQTVRSYSTRVPGYLGDIVFIPKFLSDVLISFMLAVILSLCFEAPVIVLEKHLLGMGSKNRKLATKLHSDNSSAVPNREKAANIEAVAAVNIESQ